MKKLLNTILMVMNDSDEMQFNMISKVKLGIRFHEMTLAICLNVIKMGLNRLWKGPWCWYSEELLDCCTPLLVSKTQGISFTEFQCLAESNGV